jgi:hypothetical protein
MTVCVAAIAEHAALATHLERIPRTEDLPRVEAGHHIARDVARTQSDGPPEGQRSPDCGQMVTMRTISVSKRSWPNAITLTTNRI